MKMSKTGFVEKRLTIPIVLFWRCFETHGEHAHYFQKMTNMHHTLYFFLSLFQYELNLKIFSWWYIQNKIDFCQKLLRYGQ